MYQQAALAPEATIDGIIPFEATARPISRKELHHTALSLMLRYCIDETPTIEKALTSFKNGEYHAAFADFSFARRESEELAYLGMALSLVPQGRTFDALGYLKQAGFDKEVTVEVETFIRQHVLNPSGEQFLKLRNPFHP